MIPFNLDQDSRHRSPASVWALISVFAMCCLAASSPQLLQGAGFGEPPSKSEKDASAKTGTPTRDPSKRPSAQTEQGQTEKESRAADGAKAGQEAGANPDQQASEQEQKSGFVRLRTDEQSGEPIALDTAIATYEFSHRGKPVKVDLVGVVHIGEKSYYDELNKRLAKYDSVLYELVAPKGTKIPRGGRKTKSSHPVSVLQRGMKNVLELEFQLEQVDYTGDNFVHADLTPTEFAQSMKDRNESFLKMMIRAWKLSMEQQLDPENDHKMPSDLDLIRALFSKNRALKMKRLMAGQLANMEGQLDIFGGPDGSTLITERNKRALEVLREELDRGKSRIAIFYGAGHLPDFDERLVKDFQAKRVGVQWLTAWKMDDPSRKAKETGGDDSGNEQASEAAKKAG